MSDDLKHVAFFGDREHTFHLTPAMIRELEAVTSSGIGAIFRRLTEKNFTHAELIEVIRLGLIGGGETPETSARLVEVYARPRPLMETYPLALDILSALFFGKVEEPEIHPDFIDPPMDESVFEDAGQGA